MVGDGYHGWPECGPFAFCAPRTHFTSRPATDTLNVERSLIDLAIRYCKPETVPEGAVRLFGEEMIPVCRRALLRDKTRPLKRPRDLGTAKIATPSSSSSSTRLGPGQVVCLKTLCEPVVDGRQNRTRLHISALISRKPSKTCRGAQLPRQSLLPASQSSDCRKYPSAATAAVGASSESTLVRDYVGTTSHCAGRIVPDSKTEIGFPPSFGFFDRRLQGCVTLGHLG